MTIRRTETQHRDAPGLHALPSEAVLARLLGGQRDAAASVEAAIPAIAAAAEFAAGVLRGGGRLAYAGAGSSGLMALADAQEIPGTFGVPADRLPVLFAGGAEALLAMTGAVEDDTEAAVRDVEAARLGVGDAVVCVSASGSTPYTLAVAHAARARGAAVIGFANTRDGRLLAISGSPVLLDSGPEVVAGSTRMGAGTAQKIALNMFSTLIGLHLGHVHDGFMINVVADNAKLRQRAAAIVGAVSGCDAATAAAALDATGGAVKPAILVAAGADAAVASRLIEEGRGRIGPALDALGSKD